MRNWLRVVIGAVFVLAGLGCGKEAGEPEAPPPPKVEVATPVQKRFTEYSEHTGRLEAVDQVEVRPRVSGYIKSIHFEEGERVEKDALLFVIDPRPFQAAVNQLEALVKQDEAALSLANANLRRSKQLLEAKAISQEEADVRVSEALQAEADLAAAKAELEAAELELSFTRVQAPIAGIADRHFVTEGNLVSSGNGTSTLLTTIVSHDPIYAYFEVDERSFLRSVRRYFEGELPGRGQGQVPAEMGLSDEEGFPHKGHLDFASNQLDPETATMTLRAIFQNENEFHTPGMFARIRVPDGPEREGILIPDEAIATDQSLKFVWVIDDNQIANRRTIQPGQIVDGMRVVRSGLEGNERIAVNGIVFLQPGIEVEIVENPEQVQP